MYMCPDLKNYWDMLANDGTKLSWTLRQLKTTCLSSIENRTLRTGDFAAKIENDPGGLIPGTMAEGDQRKILHLVVVSDFSLTLSQNF